MTRPAALPGNEAERIDRLRKLAILDTEPEAVFDALTKLASELFDMPIVLVSLVDSKRQWFKSNVGMDGVTEIPRDISFCSHAILENELMEIPDTLNDERFAENPLVTGENGIRFYAGAPIALSGSSSVALGTFCVIDKVPRKLSGMQRIMLKHLAAAVAHAMEARAVSTSGQAANLKLDAELVAITRSSHLLRAAVDACPIAVTISDLTLPGTPVLYANPKYLDLSGHEASEVIGRDCRYLAGEETGDEVAMSLRREVAAGRSAEVELVNHRKDGSRFLSRLTLAPIIGVEGAVVACIGLQSDIAFEVQGRNAIEHQREKMAVLGRSMGGVAHEINNMLQPVALLVQNAIDSGHVSTEGAAHLGVVLDCTRSAKHIMDNLLAFSRPASWTGDVRNFAEFLKEILPLALQTLPEAVAMVLRLESRPLLVEINRTKFTQILINLVSNAIAAMGSAGELTIELDEEFLPVVSMLGKAARLRITDTGCGMDAITMERAFEPFFTTKPIGQGTGLGLPLVYALVQEIGGIIKLQSKPGLGTTVTIFMPIAKEN
jgi:PAS domain S-box-containing protein